MKICAVDGCDAKARKRGWCAKHYVRWWRNGDPLGGRASKGDLLKFLENHRDYEGVACLLWPYSRNNHGYGQVRNEGVRKYAHVLMLEMTAGPKPTQRHEAAHSCGQGHKGCVNPKHLRWATHSENCMDRIQHGTHCRGDRAHAVKLTEAQVREIRELIAQGMRQREIAELYGITQTNVSHINIGRSWNWLENMEVTP